MAQTNTILSIAALLLILINAKTNGRHGEGLKAGLKQMMRSAPLIVGALILAGMIEVLIPPEFVEGWLSKEAGLKGIILGTLGGMIMAMGPYASFPIIASILSSGAGLGTVVAIITGWCLLSLNKLPFESGFFGLKFYTYKLILSIPFSFGAGLVAHAWDMILP
ncbi:MAG TPA: hypothetical protein GXZ68_12415 [Firmicutes bacterium]|jgi:uncharacterized membrane protein YraQ (UPF0718 family)|nr:hypothetical protein [Bacillota bacterium]